VVLPSYREGAPRSLLEAAAMARPIIATNVAGCQDVVDDDVNGLLCAARDADDLAAKMTRMIGFSPERRHEMGMAGRVKMTQQFDEKIVIRKYLDTIDEIVAVGGIGRKAGKAGYEKHVRHG
jgi:glycosyltransferase involved in cell wall biosynthesis